MSTPPYNNPSPASSNNGHVTLTSSGLVHTSELLAEAIVRRLPDAEPFRPGIWTATCPVCHDPARTLTVIVHPETRDVTVKCSQRCARTDILTALGIDPNSPGLYEQKAHNLALTPLDELNRLGDTPENRYFCTTPRIGALRMAGIF